MSRPTRDTVAGRAYLDLQNRARRERRGTQELLTLYVIERWLTRLSMSAYVDDFVLKGGMLLASFGSRRPTVDADALARNLAADIATAQVKLRLDINFGDPVTPAPRLVELPVLRPTPVPIRVLGYPIETVLAEKLATAIELGQASTRVRDWADVYMLTGTQPVDYATAREALESTAAFRGTALVPLSSTVGTLVSLRSSAYTAYRRRLGPDGYHLPEPFEDVIAAVVTFADPLVDGAASTDRWNPETRRWEMCD